MFNSRISGIEYYLPDKVVTNDEIAKNVEISPTFIEEKLGIRQRHFVDGTETCSTMGIKAAKALLNALQLRPTTIQALIVVTQSPDHILPGIAPLIQTELGLSTSTLAFDINLACSGYTYALAIASSFIQSSVVENCLLVTSECYSRRMNMKDKTVCTLFGDAASASYIEKDETGTGFISFDFGTDGTGYSRLIIPAGGIRLPISEETGKEVKIGPGITRSKNNLIMDGKEIFQFAVDVVPLSIERCLEKAVLKKNDIDYYIFHQANKYMVEALMKRMELPKEKVVIDLLEYGNTVSSSIPIALSNLEKAHKIRKGQLILLCGFGVGLSWGTCVYKY